MPTVKEFTIHLEDRPCTLGKLCRAIADRGVNIVAFQACTLEKGKSAARIVTDNPTTTKPVLDAEGATHTETQVAQTKLPHRPGSLAQATTKLGEGENQHQLRLCRNRTGDEFAGRDLRHYGSSSSGKAFGRGCRASSVASLVRRQAQAFALGLFVVRFRRWQATPALTGRSEKH